MKTRLLFAGRRFRQARAGNPYEVQLRTRDWAPASTHLIVDITTTGAGQEWSADAPAAFWRNFSAIDTADGDAAVSFCRRHGEPFDRLAPDKPAVRTLDWLGLQEALRAAADAWEPLGSDGVSRVTRDQGRLRFARSFLRDRHLSIEHDCRREQNCDTGGFDTRAKVLFAFMIESAGHHLAKETPMRVCVACHDYFEHQRSDARFCSGRCQVAYHRRPEAAKIGEF